MVRGDVLLRFFLLYLLAPQSLAGRPHAGAHEIHWLGIQKPSGIPWSTPVDMGFERQLKAELEPIRRM